MNHIHAREYNLTASPIAVGVSACLLGEHVRYDGGHKHDHYITDTLGRFFRFVPVCPEAECGLGVPREAMRLEGDPTAPHLVTIASRRDLTGQMREWCSARVMELEQEDLCGFIFKKNSPSSGLFRVKVYNRGMPARTGRGLFAATVTERFPLLPVEEEGRLCDPDIRENFIERLFAFRRWKDFRRDSRGQDDLVAFHTVHKMQLMAHAPQIYREMGRLVATGSELGQVELLHRYELLFMAGLAMPPTVRKNCDVLMHAMGHFKKELTVREKEELLRILGRYRERLVPLIVPVTLLRHYAGKYAKEYLAVQTYLEPHPAELMLRNHP